MLKGCGENAPRCHSEEPRFHREGAESWFPGQVREERFLAEFILSEADGLGMTGSVDFCFPLGGRLLHPRLGNSAEK